MNKTTNKLPLILFGIIILCFFLPFVNVSCSGQKVMSITGVQMLTGTTFQEPSLFGEKTKSYNAKPEPLAAIVLFIAAFGFLPLLVPSFYFKIWNYVLSVAGAALLLILKTKIDGDFVRQGGSLSGLTLEYDIGFWLSFILFIVILTVSLISNFQENKRSYTDNYPINAKHFEAKRNGLKNQEGDIDQNMAKGVVKTFADKSNAELIAICREHNEQEWSQEAFEAARQILSQRGEPIPITQTLKLNGEKELIMQQEKTKGIILTIIGGAIGVWVFTRLTSFAGQLKTWAPPFTGYEVSTLVGAGIALILIIVGVIKLTKKQQD